jgi:hypothetical protein
MRLLCSPQGKLWRVAAVDNGLRLSLRWPVSSS